MTTPRAQLMAHRARERRYKRWAQMAHDRFASATIGEHEDSLWFSISLTLDIAFDRKNWPLVEAIGRAIEVGAKG